MVDMRVTVATGVRCSHAGRTNCLKMLFHAALGQGAGPAANAWTSASFGHIGQRLSQRGVLCLDCIHRLEFADVPENKTFPDDANVSVYAMHHPGCESPPY